MCTSVPWSFLRTVKEGMVQETLSRDFLMALMGPETDFQSPEERGKTFSQAARNEANEREWGYNRWRVTQTSFAHR